VVTDGVDFDAGGRGCGGPLDGSMESEPGY